MSNFLSWLRSLLTGEKTSSSAQPARSASGSTSGLKTSDDLIKVYKKFFYTYHEPSDKLVTHVDQAQSFSKGKMTNAWMVALELSHIPGMALWVTLTPISCTLMLQYGDNAPDYEAYALGLRCAILVQDIPATPESLLQALQNLITNGFLAAQGKKLTYTGKIDPKQQK